MFFDIYQKLTPEESEWLEKLSYVKGEKADLLEERKQLQYEWESYNEHRKLDYMPMIVWGVLLIPLVTLLIMDFVAAAWDTAVTWAIVIAAGTPTLIIVCLIGMGVSIYKYLLKHSKNKKIRDTARVKGIENRWDKEQRIMNRWHAIELRISVLEEEQEKLTLLLEEAVEKRK